MELDDEQCPVSEAGFPKLWTNPHGSQTTVRALPRRIVALEPARITECLLALRVVPAGSATYEDLRTLRRGQWPPALHDHVPPQVVDVGWYHEPPDVERIRAVDRISGPIPAGRSTPPSSRVTHFSWGGPCSAAVTSARMPNSTPSSGCSVSPRSPHE
ncbi:MAG: hypothetical protein ACT4NY_05555 [Pseudonocardiales bacterium]